MKAYLTRSPIIVYFNETNMNDCLLDIWIDENPDNFDVSNSPNYSLFTNAIDEKASFEISELLSSENNYLDNENFLNDVRDTGKWALLRGKCRDNSSNLVKEKMFLIRFRDGYLERDGYPQIIQSITPANLDEYTEQNGVNVILSSGENDLFGNTNAYSLGNGVSNIQASYLFDFENDNKNVLSFFYNTASELEIEAVGENTIFSFTTNTNAINEVENVNFNVIELAGGWYFVEIQPQLNVEDLELKIKYGASQDDILIYNLNLQTHRTLQTLEGFNLTNSENYIKPKNKNTTINFDRLWTNFILQSSVNSDIEDLNLTNDLSRHSKKIELSSQSADEITLSLSINDISLSQRDIPISQVNECKYEDNKVEFINRFGVVETLWFFFKREDSVSSDNETYNPHQINNGTYNSLVGGESIYRKHGSRKVTLHSGFYPESHNPVFEQLFYSKNVWLNGEPVKVTSSSHKVKTQDNDKVIEYKVDFEYTNQEVNRIL